MNKAILIHPMFQIKRVIVAEVSRIPSTAYNGNILEGSQHVDGEHGHVFHACFWELKLIWFKKEEIKERFQTEVGEKFGMEFNLYFNFP